MWSCKKSTLLESGNINTTLSVEEVDSFIVQYQILKGRHHYNQSALEGFNGTCKVMTGFITLL